MTHKNLDLIVSIQSLGLVQQVSGNKMHNQKVQYFGFNSSLSGNNMSNDLLMPAAWFYPAPSFSQLHCPGSMSCPSIGHNEWIHVLSIYSGQRVSNKVHFINWKTFLGRDQKDQKRRVFPSLILGSRWIGRHWSLLVVAAIRFCSLASPLGLHSLQRGAAAKHCSWQGHRDGRPHGAPRRRR